MDVITSIDTEIEILMGLGDFDRRVFFKQFNKEFIKTYNRLGKFRTENKIKRTRQVFKVGRTEKALIRMNALLEILDSTQDHSDVNLFTKMNERGLKIGSFHNVKYYMGKLVNYGAAEHIGIVGQGRLMRVLKKEID